jgi:hypothetical protein
MYFVCYLCAGLITLLVIIYEATRQVWFVLEVKRSLKLFLHVLYATPV